jgi:hypothetical protein
MSSTKLQFADYEFEKFGYMKPPLPSLNGGLYTGEEFHHNAPYRNFPVSPDSTTYIHKNLPDDTPEKARFMYPATRKGNSFSHWKGLKRYEGTAQNYGPHHIYCIPCKNKPAKCECDTLCPNAQTHLCNFKNCLKTKEPNMFNKYYYL